ncbi:MAG: hypothetical protein HC769_01015 [Cyanobacteria bacterium CRU_2_1]|nr:hypothetical protein [Cyanobacteria bacterium RU_5_0]NJR57549.1 hypothetical protein [Cyanobacteria bacterium CRU_2_1]
MPLSTVYCGVDRGLSPNPSHFSHFIAISLYCKLLPLGGQDDISLVRMTALIAQADRNLANQGVVWLLD